MGARMDTTMLIVVSRVETVIVVTRAMVRVHHAILIGGEQRARTSVAQHVRGMDQAKNVDRQTDTAHRVAGLVTLATVAARYVPAVTATVAAVTVKPEPVQVDACLISTEQIARAGVTIARMVDVTRILVTALAIVLMVTMETAVRIRVAHFAWIARA